MKWNGRGELGGMEMHRKRTRWRLLIDWISFQRCELEEDEGVSRTLAWVPAAYMKGSELMLEVIVGWNRFPRVDVSYVDSEM